MSKRRCFICDGTGLICNVCGESEAVCRCGDPKDHGSCEDCEGTGTASADLTAPAAPKEEAK